MIADARAARAAGADVVVVSVHWGTEWQTEPDERQLSLGRALTASRTGGRPDVDLIVGTHAHVPQAYEKVNGTWVIYGMGDQIAGDMVDHQGAFDPRGNQGSIGRFTFAPPRTPGGRWEVTRAEFVPSGSTPDAAGWSTSAPTTAGTRAGPGSATRSGGWCSAGAPARTAS